MIRVFAFFSLLVLSTSSWSAPPTGEWLKVKEFAETLYTKRLVEALETQIPREHFSVNVNLNMVYVPPPPKPVKPPEPEPKPMEQAKPEEKEKLPRGEAFIPSLMGFVDAEAMMMAFEAKLADLRAKEQQLNTRAPATVETKEPEREEPPSILSQFQIRSATIVVGLRGDDYPPIYRDRLAAWIKQKVQADLRVPARTSVQKIYETPKRIEPPKPFTQLDWYRELESAVLMGLLSLTVLLCLAVWFIQRMITLRHERRLKDTPQPLPMPQDSPFGESEEDKDVEDVEPEAADPFSIGALNGEELAEIRGKLASIFESLGPERERFMTQLIENGDRGRTKAALLMDAWLHFWSDHSQNSKIDSTWLDGLKGLERYRFQMIKVMDELKVLSLEQKRDLVQEAYWDLLGYRTIGGRFVRRPVQFLQNVSKVEVLRLFSEQDLRIQSFMYMFLSNEQQDFIRKSIDRVLFKELIRKTADMVFMSPEEIESINTHLQTAFERKSGGRVSFVDQFEASLRLLNPEEEVSLLTEARVAFSERGVDLRRMLVSLAFFPDWVPEAKAKLLSKAEGDEALAMIQTFGSHRDEIISYLDPRSREMIEDDLANGGVIADEDRRKHLRSLKDKLVLMTQNKEIVFESIFEDRNFIRVNKNAA